MTTNKFDGLLATGEGGEYMGLKKKLTLVKKITIYAKIKLFIKIKGLSWFGFFFQ